MTQDIQAARRFAIEWHGDQKYGEQPYVVHLDQVAAFLIALGALPWQICAAYLHDILEDTDCPPELMEQTFGSKVLQWVRAVTGVGANRKERQQSIVKQLQDDTSGAALLKLADRFVNVRTSVEQGNTGKLKMYRKDVPLYAALFEAVSPELNGRLNRLFQ